MLVLCLASCGGGPLPDAAAAVPAITPAPPVAPIGGWLGVQTEWQQYRNSTYPASTNGSDCRYPGNALTASSLTIYPAMLRRIRYARWLVVYTPNGGTVQLIGADSGPSNEQVIASVTDGRQTPIVDGFDVTAYLNGLIDSGIANKQIIYRICGPALVYASVIEVVQ